jgi:hypothetical protein
MISLPVHPEPLMVYHNLTPSPDRLMPLPLDYLFLVQVALYLIVACLTVSSCSKRLDFGLLLTVDFAAPQLCVWDWILALSDELQMLRIGGRRLRYLLDMVYFIVR